MTQTHIVLKVLDVQDYLKPVQVEALGSIMNTIYDRRKIDGRNPENDYHICNVDEPYADRVKEVIMTGEVEKNSGGGRQVYVNHVVKGIPHTPELYVAFKTQRGCGICLGDMQWLGRFGFGGSIPEKEMKTRIANLGVHVSEFHREELEQYYNEYPLTRPGTVEDVHTIIGPSPGSERVADLLANTKAADADALSEEATVVDDLIRSGIMLDITRSFEYHVGHYLPYCKGKCKRPHGHTVKLEVTVRGQVQTRGEYSGMVVDFVVLDAWIESVIGQHLDHNELNNLDENPTAERMILLIYNKLRHSMVEYSDGQVRNLFIVSLKFWETSKSCVELRF